MRPGRAALAGGLALVLVSRAARLVLPASTKFLVDDVVGKHKPEWVLPLALILAGSVLVQGVANFLVTLLLSRTAHRLVNDLRCRTQMHLARLPVSYFDANKTGSLASRVMTDVEGVGGLAGSGMVDMIGGLLTAVLSLCILVRISPLLTSLALAAILLFAVVIRQGFRNLRPLMRTTGAIKAEITGRLCESIGGIRVIKGYCAEQREDAVFAAGVRRFLTASLRVITASSGVTLAATSLFGIVVAVIIYVGALQIFAGTLTLGGFCTFTALLVFLVTPVFEVVQCGTQFQGALAGLERTLEVLGVPTEDSDEQRSIALGRIRGQVCFDKVGFAYEADRDVLREISLTAEPGKVTALVGPSGSGKSTLLGLLASFYTPTQGCIRIDGVDLSKVKLGSYRSQLGLVLQESFLFDGSIRENVAFARPEASEEEVMRACRMARVDEFAERQQDGYNTIVGERGVRLSGGQKQRVSIARAILADPRILLLDEATSNLDSESEQMIREALSCLMKDRTTFVIAHRLSTIRHADEILFVDGGRIVERGRHEELCAAGGRYFEFHESQGGAAVAESEAAPDINGGEAVPTPPIRLLP